MDTSKEYIKMCEKAVELRNNYYPLYPAYNKNNIPEWLISVPTWCVGDYWVEKDSDEVHISIGALRDEYNCHRWNLPRQHQLQRMIKIHYPEICMTTGELCDSPFQELHQRFHYFLHSFKAPEKFINTKWVFDTYEKYWLAFVMRENYGKEWNEKNQMWISNEPVLCNCCGSVTVAKEGDLCMACGHP